MQNRRPTAIAPSLDFEPVPRHYRHDGWTPDRQRAFIAALAETGSVKAAAKRINMSPEGAYYLRRQPGADSFRAAWNAALDHGVQRLTDLAIDRAIEGVPVPIFWRGEQVGEKRSYNERLMMFILRHHMPDRYGGPGLREGTKSRDTIEREAAENCPTCKAQRAEAEAAANPDPAHVQARADDLAALLTLYATKARCERRARQSGDVAAADFTVRQLTQIELMLCMGGAAERCSALWRSAQHRIDYPDAAGQAPTDDAIPLLEMCDLLAEVRHAAWQDDAALRPHASPKTPPVAFQSPASPTAPARHAAQRQARDQLAAAQALWEAAATEAGWRAWLAEQAGEPPAPVDADQDGAQ